MHVAADTGHVEVARLLIEQGGEVDAENNLRNTPLMAAVKAGHENMVRLLLDSGADPDLKNRQRETPRRVAMESSGKQGIVKIIESFDGRKKGLFGLF